VSYPDIPVACTESGLVMLLELVVDPLTLEHSVQKVYVEGQKAEVEGFPCPACRIRFDVEKIPTTDRISGPSEGVEIEIRGKAVVVPTGKASCRYRPLRGPLFVPR
jgi:hypothetical protein